MFEEDSKIPISPSGIFIFVKFPPVPASTSHLVTLTAEKAITMKFLTEKQYYTVVVTRMFQISQIFKLPEDDRHFKEYRDYNLKQ